MSFQAQTATSFADLASRIFNFLTTTGHAFAKSFTGTGTGNLTAYNGTATSVAESWTITATSATNFTVSGSVSGAQAAATVGTPYNNGKIAFTITAGGTAYIAGDIWRISTSPKWTTLRGLSGAYESDLTTSGWTSGGSLFDKNPATEATCANASLPASATMKMLAAAEILEVGIRPGNSGANAPQTFTIAWSDDGVTFTTAQTYTGITTGWTSNVTRRFSVTPSGSHQWWRVTVSAGNTTPVTIRALDFYTHAGSAQSMSNDWPFFVVRPPGNDGTLTTTSVQVLLVDQVSIDNYSLYFVPISSYDTGSIWNSQPGYSTYSVVPAANFSMAYWLTANGRRLSLGLKVSSTYHAGYYGLMVPYARPSAYPLPVFLGGSSNGSRWSDTTDNTHCFPRAHRDVIGHAAVRDITGTWRQVAAHSFNGTPSGAAARMMPNTNQSTGSANIIINNLDGSFPLLPLIPVVTGVGPMGELDGVFWTSGFTNAAEAVITVNRIDHVVFQNVFRTGVGDYFALRLD